jgi:hypothetical protein
MRSAGVDRRVVLVYRKPRVSRRRSRGFCVGVMQIYSVDTMADAASTEKVSQAGVSDNLTSLLATLQSFQNR